MNINSNSGCSAVIERMKRIASELERGRITIREADITITDKIEEYLKTAFFTDENERLVTSRALYRQKYRLLLDATRKEIDA